jgi:hypothetical protein
LRFEVPGTILNKGGSMESKIREFVKVVVSIAIIACCVMVARLESTEKVSIAEAITISLQ